MAKRQRGKKRGVAAVDKRTAKIQGPGLTKTDASELTSPPKSALPVNKTSDSLPVMLLPFHWQQNKAMCCDRHQSCSPPILFPFPQAKFWLNSFHPVSIIMMKWLEWKERRTIMAEGNDGSPTMLLHTGNWWGGAYFKLKTQRGLTVNKVLLLYSLLPPFHCKLLYFS
jgi:hypothetical protein